MYISLSHLVVLILMYYYMTKDKKITFSLEK